MKRILLLTAMHLRPAISELFCMSAADLVKTAAGKYDITVCSLVSDPESEEVCNRYGINVIHTCQAPVGRKWNQGIEKVLARFEFDYLMQMGDDDVFSSCILDVYADAIKQNLPYFGLKQLYFLDGITGKAILFRYAYEANKLVGCGRMFRRDALERTGWRVIVTPRVNRTFMGVTLKRGIAISVPEYQADYLLGMKFGSVFKPRHFSLFRDDQMKGLDNESECCMLFNNYQPTVIETVMPLVTDVKSDVNIWSFDHYNSLGSHVTKEEATRLWSHDQRKHLERIAETYKPELQP